MEYTAVDNKKRFKRDHKEGADRPLAGRKRGSEEEFDGYREDVGLKRPRGAYFQPGDPPMEYESDSDDEENNPVTEEDPVCVSSDEGEEVL